MKVLKKFEEFNLAEDNNFNQLNEGVFRRFSIKLASSVVLSLINIKRFLFKEETISYKLSGIIANILDFMIPLKKNPEIIKFYDGNYFDMYEEKHGRRFYEDLEYLKRSMEKEMLRIRNRAGGDSHVEIDPYGEEEWDNSNLPSKIRLKIASIKNLISSITEIQKFLNRYNGGYGQDEGGFGFNN